MLQTRSQRAVFAVVVVTALLTGPLGGLVVGDRGELRVGDGTATIDVRQPAPGPLTVDRGRFGTDVYYVRVPDLVADVETVTGTPRILYDVRVPALGVERDGRRVIDERTAGGTVAIPLSDQAIPPEALSRDAYTGRVTVRVQSFSAEHAVVNRSVRVAVSR